MPPFSTLPNAILSPTTTCSRRFSHPSKVANRNSQTATRPFKSKSVCSDEVNSIQENQYYEIGDRQQTDSTFRVAHQGRYRNSIEYPFFKETEELLEADDSGKIRFPSFESTMDSNFQRFINRPETGVATRGEGSFYNEFSFDLEADAKGLLANQRVFTDTERKAYWNLINNKVKCANSADKITSVLKYKIKKSRRKMAYKIRYKVRQDLAIKRLRNKGKFIKSKKMDIRAAANMILIGQFRRK